MDDARRATEGVARASHGRLVALLAARTRDIAAAEDALAEAFRAALETWPRQGVPDRPEAWLFTAARRAFGHTARHGAVRAGATGSINGLSNCRPELFTALRSALEAGEGVEPLHEEIAALKEQVRSEASTVPAVKRRVRECLAERGIDLHLGAGRGVQFLDHPIERRDQPMLHLHGFQGQQPLSIRNLFTLRNLDAGHLPRHRREDRTVGSGSADAATR